MDYFSCFSFHKSSHWLVGVVLVDSTDYVRDAAGKRGVTEVRIAPISFVFVRIVVTRFVQQVERNKKK